eukprot:6200082-Pleurochrysis_carterae.AAC.3
MEASSRFATRSERGKHRLAILLKRKYGPSRCCELMCSMEKATSKAPIRGEAGREELLADDGRCERQTACALIRDSASSASSHGRG